ncbi:hypothetical protein CYMTET_50227 [Cymbomonas tetramitiformis]|uniref:Uncharacterized protein n=1 Tax=Cymbomonas tetramitiformis TaxID=36881 RepID=A0AAE0ETQ0_9CHLO|nr:hypothetical protein CYMTET_50227 [Cymbomonas tetramitiformis]
MRAKIQKEKQEMQDKLIREQKEIMVAKAAMEHDRMYAVTKEQVLGKSSGRNRMSIGSIPISASDEANTDKTGKNISTTFLMATQNLFNGAFSTKDKNKDSTRDSTKNVILKKPRRLGRSSSLDNHALPASLVSPRGALYNADASSHEAGTSSHEANALSPRSRLEAKEARASKIVLNVAHIWQQATRKAVIQAMQLRYDAVEEELTTANQLARTLTKKCEKLMGMDEREMQEFAAEAARSGGSAGSSMGTDVSRELNALKMKQLEDQAEMEELRKEAKESRRKWIKDRVKDQFVRVAQRSALDRVNEQNEALMDEQQRNNALFESYKRKTQEKSEQQQQQAEQFRSMRSQVEMLLTQTAKSESNGQMMNQLLSQITEMEKMSEGNMTSASLANWAKWRATERALLEKTAAIAELEEKNRQLEVKVVSAFEERVSAGRNPRVSTAGAASWEGALGLARKSAKGAETPENAASGREENSEATSPMSAYSATSGYSATSEADNDAFDSEKKETRGSFLHIPSLPLHKLNNQATTITAVAEPQPNNASNLPAYSPRFESYRKLSSFHSNRSTSRFLDPAPKSKDDGEIFPASYQSAHPGTSQSLSSLHTAGPTNPVALIRMSAAANPGGYAASNKEKTGGLVIPESPEAGRKKKSKSYATKLMHKVGKLWKPRGKKEKDEANPPQTKKNRMNRSSSLTVDDRLGSGQIDPTMSSPTPEAKKKSPRLKSPRKSVSEVDLGNRNPMYE